MNRRFSFKVQLTLSLLVGLILGYMFQTPLPGFESGAATPTHLPSASPCLATATQTLAATATPPPMPFVTLPGAWMVRFKLNRLAAPEIIRATRLAQGRLTVTVPGENRIQIQDANGTLLYEQTFQSDFISGEPPRPVDEITLIFVLPVIEGAQTLLIITPNGEARYEFPAN